MTKQLTTQFIGTFESAKNQQALAQYFDKDADEQKRFTQVVIRAVQTKPELLQADRTSLFLACQEAAQDRLLPDGKDGVLTVYNTNIGTKDSPKWLKKVQWQPMIGGLRRKLALHGFLGLRAELVYEKDKFAYVKGDDPKIIHEPKVFGARGDLLGAYAIVEDKNTGEKYRDSMNLEELEMARSKSRNPNSGAWKDWTTEMYRKVMARRLVKNLPLIGDELTAMISRDDERNYDFNTGPTISPVAQEVQSEVTPKPVEAEVVEPKKAKPAKKPKTVRRKAKTTPKKKEQEYEDDPIG